MPLRKKNRNPLEEKAREVTEVARELTDGGADSVKEFVTSAGSAVREFATTVSEAAKDLLENAEKAAEKTTGKKPAKSRRGLRLAVLLGAVVAIVANDKARGAVSSALKKLRGETTTPSWTSQTAQSDGGVRQEPVKTTP